MPVIPYILAGRELPAASGDRAAIPTAPCVFCGRSIRHFDEGGTGWLLGAVAAGRPAVYLRCLEGPCARASDRWIWRCGCSGHHVENLGDRCHACLRPRHEAEPYVRVECPDCGSARWLVSCKVGTAHRISASVEMGWVGGRCTPYFDLCRVTQTRPQPPPLREAAG